MWGNTEEERSFLEHLCSLDIDSPQIKQTHMTSIIATIGPACDNVEILQDMVLAGVNIFRLVMAYGDRYSSLGREIFLKSHSIVRFTNNTDFLDNMDDSFIYVDQKKLIDFADINSIIVIEDGPLSFIVKDKVDTHRPTPTLVCEVLNEGILGNRQTCHMNGMPDMCQLTENDEKDLSFALSQKVDMVFMSLVSDASLIKSVRKFFDEKESSIKILAKIENYKGIIKFFKTQLHL
ncbi:PK [Acanthosepion pharaonis]|uniref:pyruvate kinase n=1 Tax=Acanthosepion pharaonis TaxID=158019 RepID=A0A812BJD9_ACAPH|nr:PK [Sepia pharaonis]